MIKKFATSKAVALAGVAVLGGGLVAATPAAADETAPKTRVTFMCKMPESGSPSIAPGMTFEAGEYIFRIREEAGVPVSYTAGVRGSGLFSGNLDAYQVEFKGTANPVAGVSVKTDPGPNSYRGTASTNETQACEVIPSGPTSKEECLDGGWESGDFRNQGQCIASFTANEKAGKSDR